MDCNRDEGVNSKTLRPHWEHFEHAADIGIRGFGLTLAQAFEQAAVAMTAVITEPGQLVASTIVSICCEAPDIELLFVDWINELIYQMAVRGLLFKCFQVVIDEGKLSATALGEAIDRQKHQLAVEIKGATYTELRVYQALDGLWVAQCVVDV